MSEGVAATGAKCSVYQYHQWGSISGTCGRVAKGTWDDVPMCGIHLAAERRKQQNRDRWEEEQKAKQKASMQKQEMNRNLARMYGYNTDLSFPSADDLREWLWEHAQVCPLLKGEQQ